MNSLTVQRHHLPFWPTVALGVIAWLLAWFAAWPFSQWATFDLLDGTVLAFMMATVAISLPEFLILRRVARPPLLVTFLGVVVGGILAVGYLFNALGL